MHSLVVVIDASTSDEAEADVVMTETKPDAPEVPSLLAAETGSSDKENDSTITPQQSDQQKPPTKRSLNQWLEEKASFDNTPKPQDDSAEAVMSRDESKDSSSSANNFLSFSNMDPFGDGTLRAGEVQVVKEHISDADSDLFLPAPISDSSFMNAIGNLVDSKETPQLVVESFGSHDSATQDSSWVPPPPPPDTSEDSAAADGSVSSRARAWMTSVEKSGKEEESDSNAPQINRSLEPPQSLDPPSSGSGSYIGTRNAKKASDSWIRAKKDEEQEWTKKSSDSWVNARNAFEKNEEGTKPTSTTVGGLRSKFENKDINISEAKPINELKDAGTPVVFLPTGSAAENDVYFRSTAMGIRLKRGEDGFVRVVSVTEATVGSSIVRDGRVEPEDRIMEAAGGA